MIRTAFHAASAMAYGLLALWNLHSALATSGAAQPVVNAVFAGLVAACCMNELIVGRDGDGPVILTRAE